MFKHDKNNAAKKKFEIFQQPTFPHNYFNNLIKKNYFKFIASKIF